MDGLNNEISDVNLSYLLLAQRMLKNDRVAAMYRMGVSKELADLLAKLTLSQIVKLSSSSSLLCRFRFDDHTILAALTHTNKEHHLQQAHVSILLADQQVERGV